MLLALQKIFIEIKMKLTSPPLMMLLSSDPDQLQFFNPCTALGWKTTVCSQVSPTPVSNAIDREVFLIGITHSDFPGLWTLLHG
jgi:hypothetical protein